MEGRPGMGVNQLLPVQQGEDGALEQSDDVQLREQHESDDDTDYDGAGHPEETLAQLLQVIQERHLMAWSFAHPARLSVFFRVPFSASRVPFFASRVPFFASRVSRPASRLLD